MQQSVLPVLVTNSFLCSLIVFDSLNDAVRFLQSFWVIIVLSIGPLTLFSIRKTWLRSLKKIKNQMRMRNYINIDLPK